MIRDEREQDIDKIWQINVEAFESQQEADLVNKLRNSGVPYTSLVYEQNDDILGYIFFSPVHLIDDTTGLPNSGLRIAGLAPMAVRPAFQNRGIGSKLVTAGLQRCMEEGYDAVIVLGHAHYYPKFGFSPAAGFGVKSEYDVPDDVFMLLELSKGVFKDISGTIKYHEAFSEIE